MSDFAQIKQCWQLVLWTKRTTESASSSASEGPDDVLHPCMHACMQQWIYGQALRPCMQGAIKMYGQALHPCMRQWIYGQALHPCMHEATRMSSTMMLWNVFVDIFITLLGVNQAK